MIRRILGIAVLLSLGVLLSVLIAWAFAAWAPAPLPPLAYTGPVASKNDLAALTERATESIRGRLGGGAASSGVRARGLRVIYREASLYPQHFDGRIESFCTIDIAAGWPFVVCRGDRAE